MSMPSWTIIAIALSSFTGLFMLVMFSLLVISWHKRRKGPSSPFKLTYTARKRSNSLAAEETAVSLSRRASSLTVLNACQADSVVQAERDARRVIDKSSVFEYWWDETDETTGSKKKDKKDKHIKEYTPNIFRSPQSHSSAKSNKNSMILASKKDENVLTTAKKMNGFGGTGSSGEKKDPKQFQVNVKGDLEL